jgi:hypothetical protein
MVGEVVGEIAVELGLADVEDELDEVADEETLEDEDVEPVAVAEEVDVEPGLDASQDATRPTSWPVLLMREVKPDLR